ncbi:MAG TPA: hypothetical protein PKX48_14430 [Planctomycetota bacterium]|jgi:hypothetical protein|nr:hypothetical protein [Planctomycetota bacterium]OQC19336.1 MAG: hypothetical protein BWX69_02834 [Planctomycetes bacterium ADurb.Bin069]HNS00403.1 hypothetical protein [Planctomycetota bacterium]HNU26992.1 hypothetical protein [Planctomycetota bacterium]HOE31325.1 hypothetical protein [Planctomycetota bacterium]
MTNVATIYVLLLDENVDVWRPVQAERLSENTYRILPQPYDRSTETWQFEPGDVVACEMLEFYEGRTLAATKKVVQD